VRRHETDYFSLAAGILFVTLGVMFAVSALADWSIDGRWVVPIMLIMLGAGGVAASLTATRREQATYEQALAGAGTSDTVPTANPDDSGYAI